MLREYSILPVTVAAGMIAGAGTPTFLAAALAAAAAFWTARSAPSADLCFATLDPHSPDASIIPDALRQSLDHARRSGRRVRLRLAALPAESGLACRLSLNREGDIVLGGLLRNVSLQRPHIWLPDHPLPLDLTRKRSLTLVFEPCGPSRIRVSLPRVSAFRPVHWTLLALLASVACALDAGWLLAASLGFTFQSYLLAQQSDRTPDDPQVLPR